MEELSRQLEGLAEVVVRMHQQLVPEEKLPH
jgi:hypothetical protein